MRYALVLLLALCLPAQAQEVYVGLGPFCDTADQISRYVTLYTGDANETVTLVNAEHTPTSCAVAQVAYVKGAEVSKARSNKLSASVVEITIIGVATPHGMRGVTPFVQFTVYEVKEVEA